MLSHFEVLVLIYTVYACTVYAYIRPLTVQIVLCQWVGAATCVYGLWTATWLATSTAERSSARWPSPTNRRACLLMWLPAGWRTALSGENFTLMHFCSHPESESETQMFLMFEMCQIVEYLGLKTSERDHLFQVQQTNHQVHNSQNHSFISHNASEYWLLFVSQSDVLVRRPPPLHGQQRGDGDGVVSAWPAAHEAPHVLLIPEQLCCRLMTSSLMFTAVRFLAGGAAPSFFCSCSFSSCREEDISAWCPWTLPDFWKHLQPSRLYHSRSQH